MKTLYAFIQMLFVKRFAGFVPFTLFSVILLPVAASGQLPADFQKVELLTGLTNSVNFEFAPDGRIFILDRYGKITIYKPDSQTSVAAGELDVFHSLEDGLLGIAFDPQFVSNKYVYIHHSPSSAVVNRVSRFTMNGDQLNLSSEVVVLEWPTQRECCFHAAGDMDFDSQGNLYIATGDNTDHSTYSTLNETDPNKSSENTSSNTNDLRGKILRIKPEANGTYSIPEGNLFPGGVGGKAEIYVMGARNPFKIFVDKTNTDWLFWGEVGPDADLESFRGPEGLDEINLVKKAGNYGWPYFSGKNEPYYNMYADPDFYYDPANPVNLSKWNTGAIYLPPAEPSWLEFFHECYLAGPRYYFDPSLDNPKKLPSAFNEAFFYYDFNTSKVWVVKMDSNGNVLSTEQLAESIFTGAGFIDLKIGPDGQLYILEYGAGCCASNTGTGKLVRFDYTGIDANRVPQVSISADKTSGSLPLTINFSGEGTFDPDGDALTYEWDFQSNGTVDSNSKNPSFTYTQANVYDAQLRVTDSKGGVNSKSIQIYAGNNAATFTFLYPPDGGMMSWNENMAYDIEVNDAEDGSTADGSISCSDLNLVPSFGHLNHFHDGLTINACEGTYYLDPAGHQVNGQDDIFMVFNVNYKDAAGLTSFDQVRVYPKLMEAEFYDLENQTSLADNTDELGGGNYSVRALTHGSYIVFEDRNLLNINSVSYRVASGLGGTIEIRSGAPNGTLLSTAQVPVTGGVNSWTTVNAPVSDPGGKHDLFLVFKRNSGDVNLFDLNSAEFKGSGISTDNTPPEISSVEVLSENQLSIKFNEAVTEASAELSANYLVNNGITISSAVLQADKRTVLLSTSAFSSQVNYQLTVSNIENESGIRLDQSISESFSYNDALYRINAGGPALELNGVNWQQNQYHSGGSTYSVANIDIQNTTSDGIYLTELYGDFTYNIPVAEAGFYSVSLHFAELFHGIKNTNGTGARIFNVSIENGKYSLNNYDIIEKAGAPATAIVEIFNGVMVEDGNLTLSFASVKDKAKISAIEVNKGEETTPQPSIKIISPVNGASVAQPFELSFEVSNWEVGNGTTHIHKIVDGVNVGGVYSTAPVSFNDLSVGSHTIGLALANADHTQTDYSDQVQVNVVEELQCPEQPFPVEWTEQIVGAQVAYRSPYVFAEDLDGDGYKDLVTGGWWYKNPGTPSGSWIMKTIGAPMNNMSRIHDFDNDGDYDIFGTQGKYTGAQMAWAENDGNGNFTIHTNIPAGTSTYSETFMAGSVIGNFTGVANTQIALVWNGAESSNSPVQMLTVPADPKQPWTIASISPDSYGEAISAGDIDDDGDLDLFQGGNWLRNEGSGSWTTFSTGITLPTHFDRNGLADLDQDGRLDGVVNQIGTSQEISWFKPPADPTQSWTRKTIGTNVDGALSLDIVDIDFDGDLDVLTGEWKDGHRLLAYENDLCNSGTWTEHVLHPGNTIDHHDGTQAVDMDNDGDLDIISMGWDQRIPRVFVNKGVSSGENSAPMVANPVPDQQVTAGAAFSYVFPEATFSDPDGDALSYAAQLSDGNPLPSWLSFNPATRTFNGTPQSSGIGVFSIRLTASDVEGASVQDVFDISVQGTGEPVSAIRLNAGGSQYTTGGGDIFSADQYFSTSKTYSKNIGIANTTDDALYQTERYGKTFNYSIPVPSGTYVVKLHFAELYWTASGKRVFSVTAEGSPFLTNYDIFSESGNGTAVIKQLQVSVTDGTLNLAFASSADNAKVSAIEVSGLNSTENISPVVDAGTDKQITLPVNSTSFTATASDADGSISTYLWEKVSGAAATLRGTASATLSLSGLVEGSYTFRVTVTDDKGAASSDEVNLTVMPSTTSNTAPVASAGPDQSITLPVNSVTLNGSGTDVDGTISSYSWGQVNGPNNATFSSTSVAGPSVSGLIAGTYIFALTVTDNEGTSGTPAEMTVTVNGTGEPVSAIRLNAGGSQYTTGGGDIFSADQYFSTSKTYSKSIGIANTSDDALYQTERYGKTFNYSVPVPSGTYVVKLHFAELYWTASGKRVFSVTAEGSPFLTNYDIFSESGNGTAVIKQLQVSVTDGTLNLAFASSADNAKVSAIEVEVLETSGGNTAPVASAGPDQTITLPVNSVTLNGSGTDTDGIISSYSWGQVSGPNNATFSSTSVAGPSVSGLIAGTYSFALTVTDNEGTSGTPDQVSVTVNDSGSGPTAYRINSGGGELQTSYGSFAADINFSGGNTYTKVVAIAGTTDDALYQTERYSSGNNGTFSYNFPLSNGQYTVVLHFAEVYWTSAGKRIFDVSLEGMKVLDNYDIFSKAGASTAITETFNVDVTDGTLNLYFSALAADGGADRPKISAIDIKPAPASASINIAKADDSVQPGLPVPVVEKVTIDAYPNPFDDIVNLRISSGNNQEFVIRVYDLMGKRVFETFFSPESNPEGILPIDLSDVPNQKGSLLFIVTENRERTFKKVIKVIRGF